ncbi:MAG: 14-3-3 domain-containing protein [Lentinula lateritia]|uniref:14-3-3 domain-containing protein n=1 Tax=Lentinula lateritia TaxID=40482 RepID=A0ABQ8VBP5_9AGAR|nr:14-3-3 domain-containing protein [Lentinula novae-zelandiae]KAJ3933226.1 MAG: 14-3-3 domain-containing protein [Lentinula lateritia]KAJ4482739.1 14-3-3 domain-containing protein [Lentinula lateritia]
MSPPRAESLLVAELAAEAERYDDVISQIKTIATQFDGRLTNDERNLLSIAYKNKTNTLRNSWRIVDTLEKMQASRTAPGTSTRQLTLIRQQRKKIERELANVCKDIVKLLEKQLLPAARQGEERVFYSKMKGDYYRYLAEFAHEVEREWYADESLNAYKHAYRHAMSTLESVHPTRLGLALNFAVFYHDVRKSPERACHLAKSAFDDAVMSLDSESADASMAQTIRDSLQILQLLRDDLVLWSKEIQ